MSKAAERIARLRGWKFASGETGAEFGWLLDVAAAALAVSVDSKAYRSPTAGSGGYVVAYDVMAVLDAALTSLEASIRGRQHE